MGGILPQMEMATMSFGRMKDRYRNNEKGEAARICD